MAIHDRHYASRPDTFEQYRWRLQLLAEESVGGRVREAARAEDRAWAAAAGGMG